MQVELTDALSVTGINAIDLLMWFWKPNMTRRQPREKLVYLCENLMSNNFRKTAVVKKI